MMFVSLFELEPFQSGKCNENNYATMVYQMVSQRCKSGILIVFQLCYNGFHSCCSGVSVDTEVVQWCFNGVAVVFQWTLECFSGVSMVLQRCFIGH